MFFLNLLPPKSKSKNLVPGSNADNELPAVCVVICLQYIAAASGSNAKVKSSSFIPA